MLRCGLPEAAMTDFTLPHADVGPRPADRGAAGLRGLLGQGLLAAPAQPVDVDRLGEVIDEAARGLQRGSAVGHTFPVV